MILVSQYGDLRLQKAQKPKTLQEDGDNDFSMTSRNIEGAPGFQEPVVLQDSPVMPRKGVALPVRCHWLFPSLPGMTAVDGCLWSSVSGSSLTLGLAGQ